MIRKPPLALLALALLFVGATLQAQSGKTYTTNIVSVNAGNPTWASFYFESAPGYAGPGWTGSTALIVQCSFSRAEVITNFDEYGKQMSSQFFPVNCTRNITHNALGQQIVQETLNNTPLTVTLTMYGYSGETSALTLTVNPTSWQSTYEGCGRSQCYKNDEGSSQIIY